MEFGYSVDQIVDYISKMEKFLFSRTDLVGLEKIVELKSFLKSRVINKIINETLCGDQWTNDTDLLVEVCEKKLHKNEYIKNHLVDCKRFLLFKMLIQKLDSSDLVVEIDDKNNKIIFYTLVVKSGCVEKRRVVSKKFNNLFEDPDVRGFVDNLFLSGVFKNDLILNKMWINENYNLFYKQTLFIKLQFL